MTRGSGEVSEVKSEGSPFAVSPEESTRRAPRSKLHARKGPRSRTFGKASIVISLISIVILLSLTILL